MPIETQLDYLPMWALFLVTILLVVGSISFGFLLGDRRRKAIGSDGEKPKPGAVGTTLGLLAFLLAFNFNMAARRYESRSELILQTASRGAFRAALRRALAGRGHRGFPRDAVQLRGPAAGHRPAELR